MNNPKTSSDVMRELNELARKLGRYPTSHSWEIKLDPGSILDVALTLEEEERIGRLDALIARLELEKGAAATAAQQEPRSHAQEITAPSPIGDASSTPPATTPDA
jgi:hypothetical protein